jgi:lysozyme
MISNIEDQLRRDEGWELTPYKDTAGFWSIGCGHYLGNAVPPAFENGISEAQCEMLYTADLHHVWDLLDCYAGWWSNLDGAQGPRSNVLVNMGFNLGVPGLMQFTTFLGFMRARDWVSAAANLAQTKVYSQLPERYGRLRQQITSGQWQ